MSLQDDNLIYRAVNPAFCQFFCITEEDILGKIGCRDLSAGEAERHQAEDQQIIRTGAPMSKELPWFSKDHRQPLAAHGQGAGL